MESCVMIVGSAITQAHLFYGYLQRHDMPSTSARVVRTCLQNLLEILDYDLCYYDIQQGIRTSFENLNYDFQSITIFESKILNEKLCLVLLIS